ncbi:LysR family transcriptional regulator [Cupriavidus gilardii]|uniref:LysR substrate-binding domain-containing protein n=1 Tax=Cupriavidus gilardii TaxID=82541 RepID=UPI001ABE5559|nr:LysR substrate-binding domain-containing protein [Cupriavidus gilardii]MBO4122980.1 LysR family transcriptional regulator [Cupriavidus gilardii]
MPHIDRALRSNIKLRHLQLLVALDEFRHLGKTAEFLSISQPAVSKTLTEVEKMLGLVLFSRSTRGTEPTAAGEALIRFSRRVLAQYDRTREEIEAVDTGAAGRVRVGAMGAALPVLLAGATARLKSRSAQATVLIEEGDLTHLLPKLRLSELDLIVGRLEPGYAAPDLATEALYNEPMVAVVRPGHPLAGKRKPGWADLAKLPCVMPPPWASLRVKLEQAFLAQGLEPPSDRIETSSYLAVSTFVAQRDAAGFLARSVARQFASEGRLDIVNIAVPIELPPVGIITLRTSRETGLGASAAHLVDCLRLTAAEMGSGEKPARRTGRRRITGS